jgi:DNA-binding CsgD family transcriptional regulator/tetratricopeptide (TPR) repeat protein
MGQVMRHGHRLIGRDIERQTAQTALRRGDGVLLAGPSGVGKSELARALVDEVETDDTHDVQWLLAAASGPAIPFAAFAPNVPEVGGHFGADRDAFDLLQSLRRAVIARAGGKIPLLVVDDAHRLDEASATLVFQLVSAGSAAAIVTGRAGSALPEGIRNLWKDGLLARIDLEPLGRDHTVQLASELLEGQLDGDLGEAFWRTSRGNPLYLRELVWAGRSAGRVVAQHGMWRRCGPLAVGPRLTELVQDRLVRVSRNEMAALELVAVGDPVPLSVAIRLVPSAYVSSLQRQGLVTVEPAHGEEQVRPAHPVYREVICAGLPAARVRDLREELAAAFEGGGRLATDLVRVVSWRLDATGHEDAELLIAASRQAAEGEDWELAARLAEAALTATKEPGAALASATALNHLGRYQEAATVLGDWNGYDDDEVARVAGLRAYIRSWGFGDLDEADDILLRAEAAIGDASNRTWVAAIRAVMLTFGGRPTEAAEYIQPRLQQDGLSPRALVAGRTALALGWSWSGRAVDGIEIAESCLEPPLRVADDASVGASWPVLACLSAYRLSGRVRDTEALAASEYDRAIRRRNPQARGVAAGSLGWVSLAQGRLTSAIGHFREAVAILDEVDWTAVRGLSLAGLTESLALNADPDGAAAALRDVIDEQQPVARERWSRPAIWRAWVWAARGESSQAVEEFLAAASAARADGLVLFEVLALHSALRLGAVHVAPRLLALARWVQGPLIQAAAAQAEAMAGGNGAGLDQAAEDWAALTMWLHAAECSAAASRAHGLAGSRRRAAASASRVEAFLDHGDGPGPTRLILGLATPTLTRREREVALLAQTGLSSQAIAERLYLSVRTVDSHLASIYSKLGITGRRDLAAALTSLAPHQQTVGP